MPINLIVKTGAGSNRPNLSQPNQPRLNLGPQTFKVSLYRDKTWICRSPLPQTWRYFIPQFAGGRWYKDLIGSFNLMDQSGKNLVFEIRQIEKGGGPAFHWPEAGNRGAVIFKGTGSWTPAPLPSQKVWGGLMLKAGGGVVVGAEGCLALIGNCDSEQTGGLIRILTARAGATAGASGGAALLICTGFNSVQEMNGFKDSGWDYSLAIGAKFSSFMKSAKLVTALESFEGGLGAVESAMKLGRQSAAAQGILKEAPGLAKTAVSVYGMVVDTDDKKIIGIDIPLAGGGSEAGVFYGWSKARVLKTW